MPKYTPETIRELRNSLNETQAEFGARFGYSQEHMSRLENGRKEITQVLDLALETVERDAKGGKSDKRADRSAE